MALPKDMNRKMLAQIRGGQKISVSSGFEFRPEVVKPSGASTCTSKMIYLLIVK